MVHPGLGRRVKNEGAIPCDPMYPECVAFLRKTMRVREIVALVRLSHSHGYRRLSRIRPLLSQRRMVGLVGAGAWAT